MMPNLLRSPVLGFVLTTTLIGSASGADPGSSVPLPDARPVPRMQVIPLPYSQASFQDDGHELACLHADPGLRRPFLFPIHGPSGRSLTRMGHPHDPTGHSHHNSVWVAHDSVDGESFWSDRGPGRIVQQRVIRYDDADEAASAVTLNAWVGKDDVVHLLERRGVSVRLVDDHSWLLVLDLQFEAPERPVTFGATPFGLVGVRMARTVGVNDGGGLIRNSEGNVNEKGPDGAFRKRARWVDYSGPVSREETGGITLFDHPANPDHPSHFHVRDDGWMGACLSLEKPIAVEPGRFLRLRYGLLVHDDVPPAATLDDQWNAFARSAITDLPTR